MAEAIATAEAAIFRAGALTRLETLSTTLAAAPIQMTGDETPFLGEENEGRPAWRIEYPKSTLKFASATPGFVDPFQQQRRFVVNLEAATGRLFFVASTYDGKPDPDMLPMPPCGFATEQLSNEEEVYAGYPSEDPRVDFLGALELILHGGVGSPFQAKEIHGVYVLHSRMGATPRPVWAITLRGLPPFQARGPYAGSVPVWQRNHMRNVVDAMSGQVLFATNSPQPR